MINGFSDFVQIDAPAPPVAGQARLYVNKATGMLGCMLPDMTSCAPSGTSAPVSNQFALVNTTDTVLTLNATMSTQAPAIVTVGNVTYRFTQPSSITLSGIAATGNVFLCFDPGTGQLSLYYDFASTITVTGDLTNHVFTGDGCPGTIQLWEPTITNAGVWDVIAESMDSRGSLFYQIPPTIGTGLAVTQTGALSTFSVDSTKVSTKVNAPATSSDTCTQNTWATDSMYYYLCVAPNSWRRVALGTF